MNIIIINPDREIWDLRDEYSKINIEYILGGIPKFEKNYNDYYTANENASDIITNETLLKETFINQVAFVVYDIDAEKYAKINKKRNILIQYDELWNTSDINRAKMLLKYNNIEDVKELRNEVIKYEEMFVDINEKFALFYQYLETNGFLTYESSLVARNNIANKLANKIYDTEIEEFISINNIRLNDIETYLSSKKVNFEGVKSELNDIENTLAKQHLKVIEATKIVSEKRIQKEKLNKNLIDQQELLKSFEKELETIKLKVKNTNNEKIDLDREKIELEAEISENEKELDFYKSCIEENEEYHNKFVAIIDLCNNECKETIDGLLSENNINYITLILNDIRILKTKIKDSNIINIIENIDVSISNFITENKDNIQEADLESYNKLIKDIQDKSFTCLTIIEAIKNNIQNEYDKISNNTNNLKNTLTKINGDLETTIKSYKLYTEKQTELENSVSDTKKMIVVINENIVKNESEIEQSIENLNKLSDENRNLTDNLIEIKKRYNEIESDIKLLEASKNVCSRLIDSYKDLYDIAHKIQIKADENYEQDQYDLRIMYEIQQINENFYKELRNSDRGSK